ncbi:hypothetical protein QLQ12_43640 [Actinoplanes sp. NEAU-A12]|uniref:Uncharacterized protein n=1 Tax=Actinoplanes sandaracinus TaxID=3045177 RepID=A0ABT6X0I7_9ACTN|nr:hypothetical protein [Actinoplanes sandaracinus]MDI6105498.1 hypothetical protein [Actinoplanes sandaracinus]
MRSQAFRVLSGITTAVALIALPASAGAEGALTPTAPATATASPAAVRVPATRALPVAATVLPFRLSVPGATAVGSYRLATAQPAQGKPAPANPAPAKSVPAKVAPAKSVPGPAPSAKPVPGTTKPGLATSGVGQPAQAQPGKSPAGIGPVRENRTAKGRLLKPAAQLSLTLEVTERTRCGVLQLTTNGPADGIEWYTIGTLCKSGTATFRVEATRLPWSAGALPSLRLCNGLRPALAEGDDCDTFTPPAGA